MKMTLLATQFHTESMVWMILGRNLYGGFAHVSPFLERQESSCSSVEYASENACIKGNRTTRTEESLVGEIKNDTGMYP